MTEFEQHLENARNGDPADQYNMGMLYGTGANGVYEGDKVVTCDLRAAKEWFEKSSRQGNGEAMLALGLCYYYSGKIDVNMPDGKDLGIVGDVPNYAKAYECFVSAASNGVEEACLWLGECKLLGRGVKQDPSEAISWFLKGVSEGGKRLCVSSACASRLGDCHLFGLGVGSARDFQKCREWYEIAAANGDSRARDIISGNILTPSNFARFHCPPIPIEDPELGYREGPSEECPGEPDSRKVVFYPNKGADLGRVRRRINDQLTDDFKNEFVTRYVGVSRDDVDVDIQILSETENEMKYKVTKKYLKVVEKECINPVLDMGYCGKFVLEKPENSGLDVNGFIDRQLKVILAGLYPNHRCAPVILKKEGTGTKITIEYRVNFLD